MPGPATMYIPSLLPLAPATRDLHPWCPVLTVPSCPHYAILSIQARRAAHGLAALPELMETGSVALHTVLHL